MNSTHEVILISGMVVVTFSIRYILLAFSNKYTLPKIFERTLQYVPPAVLTAIIVPSVLIQGGKWALSPSNAYLPAALCAAIAGFLFPRKVLAASISTGLIVFVLLRFLV